MPTHTDEGEVWFCPSCGDLNVGSEVAGCAACLGNSSTAGSNPPSGTFRELLIQTARRDDAGIRELSEILTGSALPSVADAEEAAQRIAIRIATSRQVGHDSALLLGQANEQQAVWTVAFLYMCVLPIATRLNAEGNQLDVNQVVVDVAFGVIHGYSENELSHIVANGNALFRQLVDVPHTHEVVPLVEGVSRTVLAAIEACSPQRLAPLGELFGILYTRYRREIKAEETTLLSSISNEVRKRPVSTRVLQSLGVVYFLVLFVAGFMAYFMTTGGPDGIVDGLGRPLVPSPLVSRIFFGEDRLWAGGWWFILDNMIFWGSIMAAVWIANRQPNRR